MNLTYAEALAELHEILAQLQADSSDIDQLQERVERATHLIAYCRERLRGVDSALSQLLDDKPD